MPIFLRIAKRIAKISPLFKEAGVPHRRLANFGKANSLVILSIKLSFFKNTVWMK